MATFTKHGDIVRIDGEMLASDVIALMQAAIAEHGDLPVKFLDSHFDERNDAEMFEVERRSAKGTRKGPPGQAIRFVLS